MTQTTQANVFDYEQATLLPVALASSGTVNIDDVALAIETAQALKKAVVISLGENAEGKPEFQFYAIDQSPL